VKDVAGSGLWGENSSDPGGATAPFLLGIIPEAVAIVIASMTLVGFFVPMPEALAWPSGLLLTSFLPGYLTIRLVFRPGEWHLLEELALGCGLSLVITPLIAAPVVYGAGQARGVLLGASSAGFVIFVAALSTARHIRTRGQCLSLLHSWRRWLHVPLVTAGLIGASALVRIFPARDFSLYPGGWEAVNQVYPLHYALQEGHSYDNAALPAHTPFALQTRNFLHHRAFFLFELSTLASMHVQSTPELLRVNRYIPWPGVILLPLVALLLSGVPKRLGGGRIAPAVAFTVYAVATFYSPRLISNSQLAGSNVTLGLFLAFLSLYLWCMGRNDLRSRFLSAVVPLATFSYYYTAGALLFIFALMALLLGRILHRPLASAIPAPLYCVAFSAYYAYLAEAVIGNWAKALELAVLQPGAPALEISHGRKLMDFQDAGYIAALVNALAVAGLLVLFVAWGASCSDRWRGELRSHVATLFVATLVVSTGILFAWQGPKESGLRATMYALGPAMLGFGIILDHASALWKYGAWFTLMLGAIASLIAYLPGSTIAQSHLRPSEVAAVEWLCRHQGEDLAFSDFRIGGGATLLDCFAFTGITLARKEGSSQSQFKVVYYDGSPADVARVLMSNGARLLLLSRYMGQVGVASSISYYEPPDERHVNVLLSSASFDQVYDSGLAIYMYVATLARGDDVRSR